MEQEQTKLEQNWLKQEQENQKTEFEKLPSLQLEENKPKQIEVDFTTPFEKWSGTQNEKEVVKVKVRVIADGLKQIWWVNIKNPIYTELITAGLKGQTKFLLNKTGSQDKTRYSFLKT